MSFLALHAQVAERMAEFQGVRGSCLPLINTLWITISSKRALKGHPVPRALFYCLGGLQYIAQGSIHSALALKIVNLQQQYFTQGHSHVPAFSPRDLP